MPIDWSFLSQFKPYQLNDYPPGAVRLDLNESPYPPPHEVVIAILEEARKANRYPEPRLYSELQEAIAEYVGVEPYEVVVVAGGDSGIERLFILPTKNDRNLVLLEPSFSMFNFYAKLFSWNVRRVPIRECGNEWCVPSKLLLDAASDASMVVVDQPNNPTGSALLSIDVLEETARKTSLLVIDEAYHEFYGKSHVNLLAEGNVVLIRTFSKAFSLAGLRLGYLIAPRHIANSLRALLPPFNVARTSLAAGLAALRLKEYSRRIVDAIIRERERLRKALSSRGMKPYRSYTNFLLVNTRIEGIAERLAKKKVYVRKVPFGSTWMRITTGTPSDTELLLQALDQITKATQLRTS